MPTTDYATPASEENVRAIRELIVGHDGMVLQRHGAITVGCSPWEAYLRLESLEQVARITVILTQLGRGEPLPPDQVEKLLAQRQKLGLSRPGEAAEFCAACGVCGLDSAENRGHTGSDVDADMVQEITRRVLLQLNLTG